MPKQARLTGIKSFYAYTIDEAAEVCGVSARTVRTYASEGLAIMDDARPALIRGDALKAHIKNRRQDRKVKTQIDTFYCVVCKDERKAADGIAICTIVGARATLSAICETCETVVSQPVAVTRIPEIQKRLDLSIERRKATLKG